MRSVLGAALTLDDHGDVPVVVEEGGDGVGALWGARVVPPWRFSKVMVPPQAIWSWRDEMVTGSPA